MSKKLLLIEPDPAMGTVIDFIVASFRVEAFLFTHVADYATGLKELLSGAYSVCIVSEQLEPNSGMDLIHAAKAAHCVTPILYLGCPNHKDGEVIDFMDKTELSVPALEHAVRYQLKVAKDLAQLREVALRDELTGCLNRRAFERQLQAAWQSAVQADKPLTVAMLDLDHFKAINDTHGHPAGDAVLRFVATQVTAEIQPTDFCARFGGDEFALILVGTDLPTAQCTAERIHARFKSNPCPISEHCSLPLQASIGVATRTGSATPDALVAAADAALYAAKRQGRNRVAVA